MEHCSLNYFNYHSLLFNLLVIDSGVLLLKVFLSYLFFHIWFHCFLSFFPWCWADLTVLISVSECLDESDILIGISSNWKIVYSNMSKDTISINDVSGSQSDTSIFAFFNKASILFGNLMRKIRHHRKLHWLESTLLSFLDSKLFVGEVWINWSKNDLAIFSFKLFAFVRELDDLGWADKSEIEWVPNKDNIFALEHIETDFLEFTIPISHSFELWCWFLDLSKHLFWWLLFLFHLLKNFFVFFKIINMI